MAPGGRGPGGRADGADPSPGSPRRGGRGSGRGGLEAWARGSRTEARAVDPALAAVGDVRADRRARGGAPRALRAEALGPHAAGALVGPPGVGGPGRPAPGPGGGAVGGVGWALAVGVGGDGLSEVALQPPLYAWLEAVGLALGSERNPLATSCRATSPGRSSSPSSTCSGGFGEARRRGFWRRC